MAKLNKTDAALVEDFGFDFSEPPAKSSTRRGKHDERWQAAKALAMKFPGQSLKVLSYSQPSQPYNIAKAINNGENRNFVDDSGSFTAVAGKVADDEYAIWLTYNGEA